MLPIKQRSRASWIIKAILFIALAETWSSNAQQPFPACVTPGLTASGLTVLLDPLERTPVVLLTNPSAALTRNNTVVIQSVRTDSDSNSLPRLQLTEVLPGFWAQPATFVHYLKGPTSFAGTGKEASPRDWAGMPATDQRAYRLDPGLGTRPTDAFTAPPGGGMISMQTFESSTTLTWAGVAGHVYQVQSTANLSDSFAVLDTVVCPADGQVRIQLNPVGPKSFYRIAEIDP